MALHHPKPLFSKNVLKRVNLILFTLFCLQMCACIYPIVPNLIPISRQKKLEQ